MGSAVAAELARLKPLWAQPVSGARAVLVGLLLCALSGCGGSDPKTAFYAGEYADSLAGFSALAEAGDLEAQNFLGLHYYLGLGVARDLPRATAAFERAALGSVADAQFNLGLMYMNGYGIEQNNQRAYGWFFQSYNGGKKKARPYILFLADNVTPNAGLQAREWVEQQVRTQLHAAEPAAQGE